MADDDRYPMPRNPCGWYGVARSAELDGRRAVPLRYLGRELVAFRDEQGRARVLDAYCPHMGAHLGHGGTVDRGQLVCPFHQWRFDGEGRCVEAPFAKKLPPARVACHTTAEKNGIVLFWHHPRGDAPSYEIPEFPESDRRAWAAFSECRLRYRTHVQELRENFCDESHFAFIHAQGAPAQIDFKPDGPRADLQSEVIYRHPLGVLRFDTRAQMFGPGVMVVRTLGFTDSTAIALSTPIDGEWSELRLLFTAKKPRFMPWLALLFRRNIRARAISDLRHEGEIWDHKRYLARPMLQAHESTTPKFRKWYQQFYEGQ